jgi:hypothetical protein
MMTPSLQPVRGRLAAGWLRWSYRPGSQNLEEVQDFRHSVRYVYREDFPMPRTVPVIGIEPAELSWIRMLVFLLRHPDPVVSELTRQALLYLETSASNAYQIDEKKIAQGKYSNVPT